MRVVRQKIQALAFHAATTTAVDAPHLQFQDNPRPRTRQVANLPQAPVVPALLRQPTAPANRFFSAPIKAHDHNVRRTKHPAYRCLRPKACE